jgi:1-phosphofructokinase family hexose kinase
VIDGDLKRTPGLGAEQALKTVRRHDLSLDGAGWVAQTTDPMTTLSSGDQAGASLVIAGPNLTIDRTMRVPALVPGGVLRATNVEATPGGKGVNVARAALVIGIPAKLVSFVPGHTGRAAAALLAEAGVSLRAVPCPGEIRSTAVLMEDGGRVTVLNEPGPRITPELWRAYTAEIAGALGGAGALVCSGSLPPGAAAEAYADLAQMARARGVVAVVDVGGAALEAALLAHADVVVPNLGEAEALLKGTSDEAVDVAQDARPRAAAAAIELVRRGARVALVTAAAAGAALAIREDNETVGGPWWLAAPRARVSNPIGAGDAFAAGLAAALARGEPTTVAAREAVATGTAGVESPLGGDFSRARMRELLAQIALVPA